MHFGNFPPFTTCAFLQVFLISFVGSCEYYLENTVMVCRDRNPTLRDNFFSNTNMICYFHAVILSRTHLEVIQPGAFKCLEKNMLHLDISRNRIRNLDYYIFSGLSKMKHLDFSSNQIKVLPEGVFDDLVNLETIYGHSNSIKSFTSGLFYHLRNLQEIRFDNNELESLERRLFANMTSLLHLNLNHNKLKSFDGILPQHHKIRTAEITYGDIDKQKSSWQNRIEIHVEDNVIESANFHIPDYVSFLGLKGNRLAKFPTAIQRHSESTSDFKVTLSKNLWLCDCSALPLKTYLSAHRDKVVDINEVTCRVPDNTTIVLAKSSIFVLCTSTTVLAVGMIVVIIMVIVINCYLNTCSPFSNMLFTASNWWDVGCYESLVEEYGSDVWVVDKRGQIFKGAPPTHTYTK